MNNYVIFDLQLFATVVNATTSAASGNNLSAEMKTYYEKRLLDNAEPKLVHNQFGDKYPIPKGSGKTIEMRKYSPLAKATTALTEGVTPDGQALNVSTITATVKQYGGWIQLSDMLDMTAIDNNVLQATKLLGSQAGRTLDTVIREELAGGTNVIYAPKVASGAETAVTSRAGLDATAKINVDLIYRAAAQLESMNADRSGIRSWVLSIRMQHMTLCAARSGLTYISTLSPTISTTGKSARSAMSDSSSPRRQRYGPAPAARPVWRFSPRLSSALTLTV